MYTNRLPKLEDAGRIEVPDYPLKGIPELRLADPQHMRGTVPDDEGCRCLWDKYDMLANIRAHSMVVANVATRLAKRAKRLGLPVNVEAVRASALLHDLAKTWCLRHGGSHAELGATWVVQETGQQFELAISGAATESGESPVYHICAGDYRFNRICKRELQVVVGVYANLLAKFVRHPHVFRHHVTDLFAV